MLGPYQCPTEFFGNTPEILAPIREDGEFDVVGTKRHGAKGKQIDVFGSQFCKKVICATGLILNPRIEVFDSTHAECHCRSFQSLTEKTSFSKDVTLSAAEKEITDALMHVGRGSWRGWAGEPRPSFAASWVVISFDPQGGGR
jgi:hypothetical protein